MRAVVHRQYGSPDVLRVEEVERPEPADDGVLVRVRGSSVNRGNWYETIGVPWVARPLMGLRRPRFQGIGWDFAGTVEAVGPAVTSFRPGDDVYGVKGGAWAEYVSTADHIARKPDGLAFDEAAALPVAAVTALQGLRDHGGVEPGKRVLVNGASGGVGTFAIQIAKTLGADVTAVCSTRNVEQAAALGADDVIDYTRDDFTRMGRRYDVVLDNAGTQSWAASRRALEPDGRLVLIGSPNGGRFLGPIGHLFGVRIASVRGSQRAKFFVAKSDGPALDEVRDLVESGKLRPVIEARYDLDHAVEALRYVGEGHARGKLVIAI